MIKQNGYRDRDNHKDDKYIINIKQITLIGKH